MSRLSGRGGGSVDSIQSAGGCSLGLGVVVLMMSVTTSVWGGLHEVFGNAVDGRGGTAAAAVLSTQTTNCHHEIRAVVIRVLAAVSGTGMVTTVFFFSIGSYFNWHLLAWNTRRCGVEVILRGAISVPKKGEKCGSNHTCLWGFAPLCPFGRQVRDSGHSTPGKEAIQD